MKYDLKNGYKVQIAQEYFKKLIDKKAWIELKELRVPHSIDAHRLYFVWLNCIAKETGLDKDELHFLYRAKFLQRDEEYIIKIIRPELWDTIKKYLIDFKYFEGMNIVIDIISYSTSISGNKNAQDDKKFSEYLSNIRKHARVNFGVILLSMKDKNFTDFYREYGFN